MNPCPFCRIISREVSAALIAENDLAIAFLDIRPVNPGHSLVIPRRHIASFTDLNQSETAAIFQLIQQVSTAIKSSLSDCSGISLSAADGKVAGQEVPHAHFHVIPRSAEDGFGWRRFGTLATPTSLNDIAEVIRNHSKFKGKT